MYCESKQHKQRSIIKSTRHKKWLLDPSKEVTFQLTYNDLRNEAKVRKTETEIRRVAMVKDDNKSKRSGVTPFLYKPEPWPEDAATQNIETTENGHKVKSKMRMLEGDEVPEQFMIWLMDFDDKINENEALTAEAKLGFLKRLVASEAQTILSQVERDYRDNYSEPEHISLLDDYKVQKEIRDKYTTDAQVRTYFGSAGTAAVKAVRVEHIIQETIHRIKILIFGDETFGLKSYIQLRV